MLRSCQNPQKIIRRIKCIMGPFADTNGVRWHNCYHAKENIRQIKRIICSFADIPVELDGTIANTHKLLIYMHSIVNLYICINLATTSSPYTKITQKRASLLSHIKEKAVDYLRSNSSHNYNP